MAEKRLLYFTARQVSAYRWKGGRLTAEALFASKEESIPEFSRYIAQSPKALYYILIDVVEEDFHQETIPYVRGKDRRILLERKLAQRYRDLSLALAISLGYESGPRREEKILFSSFTNTQQFQPWLAALRTCEARLVGVFSVPLVSPLVGKRAGFAGARYLLVSLQRGGLRQSYVENGRIRFSRLGRSDSEDPVELARECAKESARIQQYLTNVRILPREAGPLDILVLAQSGHMEVFKSECVNNAQLRFQILDLDAASRSAGLKEWPDGLLGERLFLHALASAQTGEQFAQDEQRRHYHIWRARLALVLSGTALFAFCAALAAVRMLDVVNINQLAQIDTAQQQALSAQYSRLQAQFPKTPATTENLKGLVANYRIIQRQNVSPARILGELSNVLAATPQIELEKIDWQVGVPPRKAASAAAPPGAASPPPAAEGDRDYEVVEVSGRVNVAQSSDYRAISRLVDEFVQALRQRPGVQIVSVRLPFDLAAEKSLAGDIGDERASEVPRFTVLAAKRLGS